MIKVSIVVPVYKVEPYLNQCVSSILAQTLNDIEVILVDDGSPDRCGQMCDEWAEKDSRIVVYHKSNGGLMSAWKYGVERAKGDYIGFVDSDDWVEPEMFGTLYAEASLHDADMVMSGFITQEGEHRENGGDSFVSGTFDRAEITNEIFPRLIVCDYVSHRGIFPNRWSKLFRKDILLRAMPYCDESVSLGEDLLTLLACFLYAQKVRIVNGVYLYHYRINDQSMIQSYSDAKYEKFKRMHERLLDVNAVSPFDFSEQIHQDYISLLLVQIECEILFSGKPKTELKQRLKAHYRDEIAPLLGSKEFLAKFSRKHNMYLFLLRHRLYGAMIAIRRAKG